MSRLPWALLTLTLCAVWFATGCGRFGDLSKSDSAQASDLGNSLKVLLPEPPAGWKLRGERKEERVAGAGDRAWAAYERTAADAGSEPVQKVVVVVIRFEEDAGDQMGKLMGIPPVDFDKDLEQWEVRAQFGANHTMAQVGMFGKEPPKRFLDGQTSASPVGDLFLNKIDLDKLGQWKPSR